MASTLLLDRSTWDLVLDAAGNIAVASEPYALAQDAASAIKTQKGECIWDTTVGIPLFGVILGARPSVPLMKSIFVDAALTVPGVTAAKAFITGITHREVSGQVQVTSATVATAGQTSAASFTVINPQGAG